jgi:NTE family protein
MGTSAGSAPTSITRALVLSGGGARGAYEAGVLRFIVEELPKHLGRPPRFDLMLGTSVGAIHACYLAATADAGPERGIPLRDIWQRMRLEEMLRFSPRQVLRLPRRILDAVGVWRQASDDRPLPDRIHGVLDTQPLEQILVDAVPWKGIRRNLKAGHLDAVCVTATQLATGRVVIFVDGVGAEKLRPNPDPSVIALRTRLAPEHALASAAIPVFFPAVRIDSTYYVDGGLRLNTPLAPAINLGAQRILVIALRQGVMTGEKASQVVKRVERWSNPALLYGKIIQALLLDHLATDLGRMQMMNSILRSGEEASGPTFLDDLNRAAGRPKDEGFRIIEDLVIRPSQDLGALANTILKATRSTGSTSAFAKRLLGVLGAAGENGESDLLSCIFFDTEFTSSLMALGFEDARTHEEQLVAFFSDPA